MIHRTLRTLRTLCTLRALWLAALLVAPLTLPAGCKEEPTIVITFAPQDLAARPADLAKPVDLARPADLATAATGDPCKKDADCTRAKADCCDCNAGGRAISIGRARVKAHEKELASRCRGTMCPQMISNDPSCSSTAACVAGRCALAPAKAAGAK
jgi:hypothetical protein